SFRREVQSGCSAQKRSHGGPHQNALPPGMLRERPRIERPQRPDDVRNTGGLTGSAGRETRVREDGMDVDDVELTHCAAKPPRERRRVLERLSTPVEEARIDALVLRQLIDGNVEDTVAVGVRR